MKVLDQQTGEKWSMFQGDCCEVIKSLPDDSMHYSVFSPPFSSLYVYSDSDRDMGNCESDEEFFQHFQFLVKELLRVIKPGRLVSVHCMNLPSTMTHQGYIGIRDFRGEIIRLFLKAGFIYHSEVCIWKDPVVAMQRTKALGLLHKQIKKDSCRSRMGLPDYVCTFRKPGLNPEPVEGPLVYFSGDQDAFENRENAGDYSIDVWQRYASPVWHDINQSNTLNYRIARGDKDERHICPLQLDVIERCLQLWTNPDDVVLSPFAGIGSEGFVSVQRNRKFVGIELKPEYFQFAVKNLDVAEQESKKEMLF